MNGGTSKIVRTLVLNRGHPKIKFRWEMLVRHNFKLEGFFECFLVDVLFYVVLFWTSMKDSTFISLKVHFVTVRPSFEPVKISLCPNTIPRDSVGVFPRGCNSYNPDHSFWGRWRWVREVERAGLSYMIWWQVDQNICHSSSILQLSWPLPSPA